MWYYFTVPESIEGTTLHADGAGPPYMEWVWQIPIHPNTISVGYVSPGESVKEKRQQGMSVQDIFLTQLERFPDLQGLLQRTDSPRTTSFRCRVFAKIAGPNWLVAGEAAAMVDPMTSNGVTAALRQGAESAALIIRYRKHSRISRLAGAMYSQRVLSLARFFNSAIENVLYDWPIRNRIGAFNAGDISMRSGPGAPQCRLLAGATARIRVDYPLQVARGVFEVVHQPISLGLQLITPLVDYLGYLVKAQRTGNNWG